ncbi:MAG: hypothetical protein U1E51_06640 [Candidatus Binatia bacterium]|nr:hypothetical protein [Candidatus Binatia bacterium]
MALLDTAGSTLFKLTWKARRTPLGRRYLERAASGLRTSGGGCTSLPTPRANASTESQEAADIRGARPNKNGDNLDGIAMLATVATPQSFDANLCERSPEQQKRSQAGRAIEGRNGGAPVNLREQVRLATVATPAQRDYKSNQASEEFYASRWDHPRGKALTEQAQLADSGQAATGGMAGTASGGQLNPAYSRWLMGLPPVWDACAVTAMQSYRKSRKRS